MPKIDIAAIPVRERTGYPPPYAEAVKGRLFQALGDAAGLTQFGVNLVRLKPGAASSQRHWHENEDEFLIVLEGELVLVEDEGETILRAGDTAGFKAGVPNGHHLLNRTERDGVFLVVGSRAPAERAHYPDVDLLYEATDGRVRYTNRAGEPFA
ncbi:MAG: cupin domain-containing protein [Microvirga sp.]